MGNRRLLIVGISVLVLASALAAAVVLSTGGQHREVAIELTVAGGTMRPDSPSARQGDRVTMTITADRKEEIHLHGYDLKFELPASGTPVTKTFTADRTGPFEIEIEDSGTHLGQFTVSP